MTLPCEGGERGVVISSETTHIVKVFNGDTFILAFTFAEILIGLFSEKNYGKN